MLLLQFFPLRLFLQPANPHFGHLYKTPPQCEPSAFPEQFAIVVILIFPNHLAFRLRPVFFIGFWTPNSYLNYVFFHTFDKEVKFKIMEIQQIIFLAIIGAVIYFFRKNKDYNSSAKSKDTIKEKKTIPEITDTKAIQLFDLIKIDYKKLAFDRIEIYSPIGTEYCYELFEKSANEFSRSGKDEYIVYSVKTAKPFHGIFELIKAKYRIGNYMINYPVSGGLYFISGDPESIDINNVIEFTKKLITILGNPLAYDGEELDTNKIKKSLLKDKKDLYMFWSDIFSITDEDGDTDEHSVSFFYNYEDSIYELWIA